MGLGTKFVVAAVALGVLSSPAATGTVLGHAQDAFASIRGEATAELATLRTGHAPSTRTINEAAHPAARRGGTQSYRFTVTDGRGRPGRWNPCQTIPIIVNTAHAPVYALRDLRMAVARVNAASGLHFKIAGTTQAHPSSSWGLEQWAGSGTWSPVLISFGGPGTGDLGHDGSSGITSPVWVDSGTSEVYVSGAIVFNSRQNHMYRPGFGASPSRGELFEHELGHLAGLDHVDDRRQVMYPRTGFTNGLGAGDRAGLEILGSGGCLEVPAPNWAR